MSGLDVDTKDRIMSGLNEKQREFIRKMNSMKKKDRFKETLIRLKSQSVNDPDSKEEIDKALEWELIDFLDGGSVKSGLSCECGRPLRYQYIVQNKSSKDKLKLGKQHFQQHMNISEEIVKDLLKGMNAIDDVTDEILEKIEKNKYGYEWLDNSRYPLNYSIPDEILDFQKHEIPIPDFLIWKLRKESQRHVLTKKVEKFDHSYVNETTNTFQMVFDDETTPTRNNQLSVLSYNEIKNICFQLMVNGISSVNEMALHLIKNYGANSERYLTNKHKLTFDILISFKEQKENGQILFYATKDLSDTLLFVNLDNLGECTL